VTPRIRCHLFLTGSNRCLAFIGFSVPASITDLVVRPFLRFSLNSTDDLPHRFANRLKLSDYIVHGQKFLRTNVGDACERESRVNGLQPPPIGAYRPVDGRRVPSPSSDLTAAVIRVVDAA
jgi:hypothetical protein